MHNIDRNLAKAMETGNLEKWSKLTPEQRRIKMCDAYNYYSHGTVPTAADERYKSLYKTVLDFIEPLVEKE